MKRARRLVGCVLVRDGLLLLGKRSRRKREWPGTWDLPGGHVEPHETFVEALLRETEEEIGVVPQRFTLLADCRTPEGEPYRIFRVDAWTGGEPSLSNNEHSRLAWFTPLEASCLASLADERYVQLFTVLDQALQMGRGKDAGSPCRPAESETQFSRRRTSRSIRPRRR